MSSTFRHPHCGQRHGIGVLLLLVRVPQYTHYESPKITTLCGLRQTHRVVVYADVVFAHYGLLCTNTPRRIVAR